MRLAWRLVAALALLAPGVGSAGGACSACAKHEQILETSNPDPELEPLLTRCQLGAADGDARRCEREGDDCPCLPACERLLALTRPAAEQRTIERCGWDLRGVRVTYQACQ